MSTTAAENHVDEDGDFRGETKYKQFSAAVERALKGFEVSTEWPDLISSLAKLNKVSWLDTETYRDNILIWLD